MNDEINLFQTLLVEESGLYFSSDRKPILDEALQSRVKARRTTLGEYYNYLKFHPEGRVELKALYELLTIGETYFFRNQAQFDALQNSILPEIIKQKAETDRNIKIWSAGCATGEEPYSIAILLKALVPDIERWNIQISGSDINQFFLKRAKEGVYSQRSISHIPTEYLSEYFVKKGANYYLDQRIKTMVDLSFNNLATDPAPEIIFGADIIFCRNVTIYFNFETAKKIIESFYDVLNDQGYLILGHSETLWQMTDKFKAVEFPQTFVYQKDFASHKKPVAPVMPIPNMDFEETRTPVVIKPKKMGLPFFKKEKPDPEDIKQKLTNAYDLANASKYEEALNELRLIVDSDNLVEEAYYLMGILFEKTQKYEEAIKEFKKAIYVDPQLSIAYYNLGNIYSFLNKKNLAGQAYGNAVKIVGKMPPDSPVQFSESLTTNLLQIACERRLEKLGHLKRSQK